MIAFIVKGKEALCAAVLLILTITARIVSSNWTCVEKKDGSVVMTSDRTIGWKKIHEMILKTPVVLGKICCALLTATCGFFSTLRQKRREDVTQSVSLPTWHQSILWHGRLHTLQICLKSLRAAQINWSLEEEWYCDFFFFLLSPWQKTASKLL